MKRLLLSTIVLLVLSTVLMAKPAKREVLDSLLQAGDTARYEQMVRHQAIIQERVAEIQEQKIQQRRVAGQVQTACPLNIAPRGLVILVNFADKAFITDAQEMRDMINGDNYSRSYKMGFKTITAKGSARQYFIDQSWGQYQPQFDVAGPYTVSKNMSYYGGNDYSNEDKNPYDMIIEACQLADADGVDFTQYDNNQDGEIDFVYVFYAGYGEADGGGANTIWPHTFWIKDGAGKTVLLDGKLLNSYACGNELSAGTKIHDGIGTFCHEFSHVLGLPDMYYTGNSLTFAAKLMGTWDIMDYGPYNNDGNTPPSYSAYERFFMGWLTPTQITGNKDVLLHPLNSGRGAGLIAASTHNMVGNDPNPATFYLLENRPKEGWDQYIPGSGMMLTKIQYNYSNWFYNTTNNNANKLGVDIIEADGINTGTNSSGENKYYNGKAGDLFPGSENVFEYTAISDYEITNIGWGENYTDIEFRLNQGGTPLEIGQEGTAIESIEECIMHSAKCIVNGQMVIIRGEKKYDIVGRRIE